MAFSYEDKNSDDFVTIGTSLPQGEDDELLPRKPIALHEQVVRDDQGRIRFHGAFTGGFSAGYFNSVDTKEGWAPKTFKSSRAVRKQERNVQRPEDFMDEEDFGEFGIAPRKLLTNDKYRDDGPNVKKSWKLPEDQLNFSLFSNSQLQQCIEIAKLTIGQKLLKKLGWKNSVQKVSKQENMDVDNIDADFEGMFGCELPPGYGHRTTSKIDDVTAVDMRPDDVCPVDFSIQYNMFGMGYTGLVASSRKKKEEVITRNHKSKGIKGHAFGVGALEDEDEDIYGGEKISNYDTVLYTEEEVDSHIPSRKHSYDKKEKGVLTGFKKSPAPSLRMITYQPPVIPHDFKLTHVHPDLQASESSSSSFQDRSSFHKNSFSRGEILGETPNINSVFELISEKDKIRIEAAKRKFERAKQNCSSEIESKQKQEAPPAHTDAENRQDRKSESKSDEASHSTSVMEKINANEQPEVAKTEWEKEQEKDRQEVTSNITKQLHSTFFDRFTKGSEDGAYVEEKKKLSEKENAASVKLFGRLTRENVSWHPAKLLCVRFNVEDPYPESSVTGLPTQKHSKQSIFDFFKPPETMAPMTIVADKKEEKPAAKQEKKTSAVKPLAVLATVDLRPSASTSSTINLISSDAAQESQLTGDEKILVTSSEEQVLEEEKEPSPPSIDIFKAIFEDTDEEEEKEGDDDDGGVEKTDNPKTDVQSNPVIEQTQDRPFIIEVPPVKFDVLLSERKAEIFKGDEMKSEKKKHKKDKHKHKKEKHKHSHKSKKQKKSKKYKNRSEGSSSGDDSDDGDLSKVDRKLLLKLRELS